MGCRLADEIEDTTLAVLAPHGSSVGISGEMEKFKSPNGATPDGNIEVHLWKK